MCIVLSTYGSYALIYQSMVDFDESSISMVVESVPLGTVVDFPSVGVCEVGNMKEIYSGLEETVEK